MAQSAGSGHFVREAASWTALALVVAVAITHFDELTTAAHHTLSHMAPAAVNVPQTAVAAPHPDASSGPVVEIAAGRGGHFRTEAEIGGRPVAFVIDTGATMVSLSYEDAQRAGIRLSRSDFTTAVTTANGTTHVAPVRLDHLSIGGITVRKVDAAVSEPGHLKTSLLGMSFLGRLSRFDMRAGILVLQE